MEKKEIEKNHIRVRFNSRVGNIIRYVNALIKEDNPKNITFSAIGGAIGILVNAVEVIKIVNPGFYQLNVISSVAHKTVDNTEKTEVIERLSPKMDITLSLENFSNTSDEGYQAKLEEEERLKLFDKLNEKGTGNRNNRGPQRGGRNNRGGNRRGNNNFRRGGDRDRPTGRGRGGPRGGQRDGQRGGFRNGPRDNRDRDNGFRGYRDGPRDDFRGQRNDYRGQREDFRGQREDFRGQREDFRGPREDFRGPREDFRGQREDFRGPRENRDRDNGFRGYRDGPRNDYGDRFNSRGGQRGFRGGQNGNMRSRPMQMRGRGGNFSGNRRGSMNRF